MLTHELAQKILSAGNCPIPGETATELLSVCADAVVPNSLLNFSEFSGARLAAVAKSSPKKAKLVAQHSSDREVFAEILATPSLHELALPALLGNEAFCDEQQLIEVHRLAWEEHLTVYSYRTARSAIVGKVPLRYQLDYLRRDPHISYPLAEVAHRIGRVLATGVQWPLEYLPDMLSLCTNRRSSTTADTFVDTLATAFATADSSAVLQILQSVKMLMEPALYDKAVRSAYRLTPLVDVDLLEEMLSRLDTAEAFAEYRARCLEQRRLYVPAYPPELSRMNLPFTRAALCTLATAYPAAIEEVVSRGEYATEDVSFVLDLAARTNVPAVAVAMLQSSWSGPSTTRLNAEQFSAVMRTLASLPESDRPKLDAGIVRAVPADAALCDVLTLMSMVSQVGDFLYQRFTTSQIPLMSYTPSKEDVAAIFAAMTPAQRVSSVSKLLHLWSYNTHPLHLSGIPEGLVDAVAAGVDSIPVSDLVAITEGPKYLATMLAATFGDAAEKWRCAIALAVKATVPLSKVLSAADRLVSDTN